MNKTIQYLAVAFIVQCVLLATVIFGKNSSNLHESSLFVEFDAEQIDSVVIKDAEGEILLKKEAENWVLPDYSGLPASENKVEDVLKDLAALKVSWPIASTEQAAKRFEVKMENAQKSIKLKNGSEIVANLYLGTSPGYRKIHARVSSDTDIYAVEFAQHRVSNKHEDWFDKGLLKYEGKIDSVNIGDVQALSNDNSWSLMGLKEDTVLDSSKIATWVKRFNNLQVTRLITGNDREKIVVMDPTATATINGENGQQSLAFFKKDDKVYISQSGASTLFEIASYQASPLLEVKAEDFTPPEPSNAGLPESAQATQGLQIP